MHPGTKRPAVERHLLTVERVDQITIERARRGERDALQALMLGLQDTWYRFCLTQLRDTDTARDATQETAVRFMRHLPAFRGESRIETWSLGIALNVVREFRRNVQKNRQLESAEGVNPRDPATDANERDTLEPDELQNVHKLLSELPERQREAIVLRFFEDRSVEETAQAMNCAEGTIKATVFQALRSLRQKLTKQQ